MVEDYRDNYVTGWISVYRSVLTNPFWVCEKFTRGQAWIDLLLLAKYKKGFFYKRDIKVNYESGYVTEGIINLSKRWKWSRNKTQKFINDLEKEQQVKQHKSHVITMIELVNYSKYQQKRTTDDTTAGQQTIQQQDTHNKDNNINKEEEVLRPYNDFIIEVKNGEHDYVTETWLMKLKISKHDLSDILKNDFKAQILTDNKVHKNTLEVRKHFYAYLNKLDNMGKLGKYKKIVKGML